MCGLFCPRAPVFHSSADVGWRTKGVLAADRVRVVHDLMPHLSARRPSLPTPKLLGSTAFCEMLHLGVSVKRA